MIPGLSTIVMMAGRPFEPVTFMANDTWVVPDGVTSIKIDAVSADATGGWSAVTERIYRHSRSVSLSGTDGDILHRNWTTINNAVVTELNKFPSSAGNGAAVTYNYNLSNSCRYANSTPTTWPRWLASGTANPFLTSSRKRRYRSCTKVTPDFTGITMGGATIEYSNWPSSTVDWEISGERYEYTSRGGSQSVTGSTSGSLVTLADRASFTPEAAQVDTFPPSGNTQPTSSSTRTVVPGETLTIAFSATGNDRSVTISPA